MILPKPLPWKDFMEDDNDFEFVVMERDDGSWMATSVTVSKDSMKAKVVKKSWLGLSNDELSEKAGVPNLVFYHKTGYILVGKTKESVLEALSKI